MNYRFHDELLIVFEKLNKKDNPLYQQILKKIDEVINTEYIEHYKNLNFSLQQFKRVHITKRYVLIFMYNKTEDEVLFRYFDHRDNIYNKKYD